MILYTKPHPIRMYFFRYFLSEYSNQVKLRVSEKIITLLSDFSYWNEVKRKLALLNTI